MQVNFLDTIVCWFSCGAASAVATKQTIDSYGDIADIRVVNNPVKEEDSDNLRFLKDVENWLNIKIETSLNPKYPDHSCETVWKNKKYMAGVAGAPCTYELKKQARYNWEKYNNFDHIVLGFTSEEKKRYERFILTERSNVLPILIDNQITKQDCFNIIKKAGIELPRIYKMGYPNANCIGCVKSSSPTYWNHVRKHHPDIFEKRSELSRKIGAKLVKVKGERIFLDELKPTDKGRNLKKYNIDCGIFCEENYE